MKISKQPLSSYACGQSKSLHVQYDDRAYSVAAPKLKLLLLLLLLLIMEQIIIKVTIDFQGCLPENNFFAHCFKKHSKLFIFV